MLAERGWGKTLFEQTLRRITELCIMYIFYSLHLWPCPVYSFVQSECRQRITCSLKWDKAATPGWGLPLVLEQPSQLPVCVWTGTSPLCSWPCGNWCPGPLETSRLRSPSLHIISLCWFCHLLPVRHGQFLYSGPHLMWMSSHLLLSPLSRLKRCGFRQEKAVTFWNDTFST